MLTWSPKQRLVNEALLEGDYHTIVVPGPVQSGKTFSAVFNFHLWAMTQFTGQDFILGTKSHKQMQGVLIKYSQQFSDMVGGGWQRRADYYSMESALGGHNRFYALLGGSKGTEERARSFSAQGALLDEATLLDDDFVNTVFDRLSRVGSKMVMVMNPSGPLHPIKVNFIDRVEDDPGICHIPFEVADNPTLKQSYVAGLDRRYSGPQHRRMVLGEWATSEGLVYPYIMDAVADPPKRATPVSWSIGIDWAHSSSTHAVLVARMSDGTDWVLEEWEHHGQDRGILNDFEQAQRVVKWVGARNITRAAVDPSALAFIAELRRVAPFRVVPADTDVAEGIQYVRAKTEDGQLFVSRRCPKLISQMANYRWDERAGLLGVDKPIKENDHGPDALRYDRWTAARPRRRVTVRKKRALRGS